MQEKYAKKKRKKRDEECCSFELWAIVCCNVCDEVDIISFILHARSDYTYKIGESCAKAGPGKPRGVTVLCKLQEGGQERALLGSATLDRRLR